MRFVVYFEGFITEFETLEKAKAFAEDILMDCRSDANDDGWSCESANIVVAKVTHRVKCETQKATEEDYESGVDREIDFLEERTLISTVDEERG